MLEVTGPQLNPLGHLILQFDRKGLVPDIYNVNQEIVLSYPHRTYNERYIISRSGIIGRFDVTN